MSVYPADYAALPPPGPPGHPGGLVLVRAAPVTAEKAEKAITEKTRDAGAAAPRKAAAAVGGHPGREDDVAYHCLRPLWLAMQAVGFFPVQGHCRGRQTQETPQLLALAALQYAAALTLAAAATMQQRSGDGLQDFDGIVIKYMVYLQCGITAALLPAYALQRASLARYLHEWNELQVDFAQQSGRSLATCGLFAARDSWEVLGIVALWLSLTAGCHLALHPAIVVAALTHSGLVSGLLAAAWSLHGRLIRSAARATADHLAKVLSRPAPSPAAVDAIRLQLVRVLSLAEGLGAGLTLAMGLLLLLHFVLETLSLYALFGQLSPSTRSAARLPGLVAGSIFSGAIVYLGCDNGYRVARTVKSHVLGEVMAFRRRTPRLDPDLHDRIEALVTTARQVPGDLILSGITDVNRHLFSEVLATMVTYLVVVIQFRVSLVDLGDAEGGGDATTTTTLPDLIATNATVLATMLTTTEAAMEAAMEAATEAAAVASLATTLL